MATINQLMPYLERGYQACDPVRHAYLSPYKKDGALMFEWKAYEMEGEWSGPDYHTQEYVRTWRSSNWGIHCRRGGNEYSETSSELIDKAITAGLAFKAEGFESEKG